PGAYAFWRGKMLKIWRAEVAPTLVPSPRTHAVGAGGRGGEGTILSADPNNFLVACGEGALRLLEVQPESRPRMEIRAFVNGYRPQGGERLE
ncbi:hypothetical protein ABTC76_19760, partial [Acinetobacter baumannii]